MPGHSTANSKMKDKTKASEESSKAEEEPQKPEAYEFFEPKESAKVNSKLKERVKIWRENKVEKVPKSCQNGKNPAKGCNGHNEGVTNQYKIKSEAKSAGESSKSEKTKAFDESSEADKEPQKPVTNEFKPVTNEFFEPKESAIFNFKVKEKTKLSEGSSKAQGEPQKPVTNEFFKPTPPKEPAILKWLQDQGLANIDLTTASAELKAKEELQKAVVYNSFELKESTKVHSKLGAYEFVEPKESAEVDSETKANLRAKFEVNQINRGVLY